MMTGETGTADCRSFSIMGPALKSVRDLCDRNAGFGTDALCTERVWRRIQGDWAFAAREVGDSAGPAGAGDNLWELLLPQGGDAENVWGLPEGETVAIVETEEIGRGAFGSVMRALGPRGELLAIKHVCLGAGDAAQEARREYEVMRRLQHPSVVRVYDLLEGDEESDFRIVMEFMAGGSVQYILKEYGPLYNPVCVSYTAQTIAGLQHLHRRGVIHSDIKPANLLVQASGALKLADFGLCRRAMETRVTMTMGDLSAAAAAAVTGGGAVAELLAPGGGDGNPCGTLPYMSPALLREVAYTAQSDLWAFGCTLLEMATGAVPWGDRGWGQDPAQWAREILAAAAAGDLPTGAVGSAVDLPEGLEVGLPLREFATRCLHAERDGAATEDLHQEQSSGIPHSSPF
eukprot:gene5423-7195_t